MKGEIMTTWQILDIMVDVTFVFFIPIGLYILFLIYQQLRELQIGLNKLFARVGPAKFKTSLKVTHHENG